MTVVMVVMVLVVIMVTKYIFSGHYEDNFDVKHVAGNIGV